MMKLLEVADVTVVEVVNATVQHQTDINHGVQLS
jgi:hypothetical protein